MSRKRGAPSKDARLVLGSLIIKHMCNLSDQATIEMIQENIYMQYFVGLSSFSWDPIFDSSLFVTIRKRLSKSLLDNIVVSMIKGETDFVKKKVSMQEL
ncbi:transposase [Halosquirtibacter laminarini]|uniref:Transposase n=1 Tax=Halosquirtibacter laminarini TaxID=3374600 RepID=A0AC61NN74_9BACT|nr:transposase [Prolixibacteraceae bacterium]